ncbi:MAG: hypothetical protein GY913_21640 [Proteobacteria bacterium]|nr:hypothetical protein [Actinomycetes bacterium]MCP4919513.1 hypothetical protein [Pseudomonadota bacterium]
MAQQQKKVGLEPQHLGEQAVLAVRAEKHQDAAHLFDSAAEMATSRGEPWRAKAYAAAAENARARSLLRAFGRR